MKKISTFFIVFIITVVSLSGCGQKTAQIDEAAQNQTGVQAEQSTASDENTAKPADAASNSGKDEKSNDSTKNVATSAPNKGSEKAVDQYKTQPVPEGKPEPVEPQEAKTDQQKKLYCTLSITCNTVLSNMDKLNPDKAEIVPQDGVIFEKQTVEFFEGESVFNVLLRETRKNKIHMEFAKTPMFNSNYIEGIHNLYEFDCGELSGWIYRVNGWFPNYGCSRYQLKDGDVIEWVYTCDLGRDVGASGVNQKDSE